MSKLVDNIIAFKLLKMLVTPFDKTDAYKLGIIDENGKLLRKSSKFTRSVEHDAYNYLTRFMFNMKRLVNKFGGEHTLKSVATALYLFKEHHDKLDEPMLTEEFDQLLEDHFYLIMEDEHIELELDLVEKFLAEEMTTVAALPKGEFGETTPVVKKKKYKILRRDIVNQMGDKP